MTPLSFKSFSMSYRLPQNYRPTMKAILVGSSGVGKTCLISAYLKQSFDEQKTSTVAPSYSFIDVKNSSGVNVRLQIWDTAGQERYHSVSQLFFRDSDIAFVCYEAGDEVSFGAVPGWVRRVRDEVPACDLFFVITKSDLKTKEVVDETLNNSQQQFAQFEPKGYFVTSAKSNEGVQDVFNAAIELYKPKNASNIPPADTSKKEPPAKKGCC